MRLNYSPENRSSGQVQLPAEFPEKGKGANKFDDVSKVKLNERSSNKTRGHVLKANVTKLAENKGFY